MLLKKHIVSRGLLLLVTLFGTLMAQAQTVYHVRAGATGAGNGSDWNNAYSTLPATLQRGATYYVADGNYGSYTCDDALSGSAKITIKKATETEHGSSLGWSAAYGDGQAIFGNITLHTGYYVWDGATRNESSWGTTGTYGIRASAVSANSVSNGDAAEGAIIKYCELGGTYSTSYYSGMGEAVYMVYNQNNITISRCFLHNSVPTIVQGAGLHNSTFEYCWIGPGWGKVAIRLGNGSPSYGNTFRYNIFWNSAQKDPEDSTSGLTSEIAAWHNSVSDTASLDNNVIYGNVFYSVVSGGRNSSILIGGTGSAPWNGAAANGTKVYNNTFAGFVEPGIGPLIWLNGSNTEAKNNLGYNLASGALSVQASSTANNSYVTVNPFVNYGSYDFHLSSAKAGGALASPYNSDMSGVARGADGVFDIGAFEFSGGPDVTPPSVTGATAGGLTTNSASITFSTSESARSGVEFGPTTAYGSSATNYTLSPSHSVQLNGLTPNTLYHYRIHATDAAGNRASTTDASFQTSQLPVPDTTAPVVSGIGAGSIGGNSATVSFTLSEPARSGIQYGTTTSYGSSLTNASLVTAQSFNLNALQANTVYHYRVSATDASGNSTVSGDATFQTTALDTVAPTVALAAPINGAVLSNTVSLAATATDNGGVVGVSFLLDGTVLGTEDTTAPYGITWDTGAVVTGTHSLAARARDAAGNQTTTTTISVTIVASSTPPTLMIGDRIAVNSDPTLRVRSSAALAGTVVGEQLNGALGTIIGGPVSLDGYTWWEINYDTDPDGWSIEGTSTAQWLIPVLDAPPAPPSRLRVTNVN